MPYTPVKHECTQEDGEGGGWALKNDETGELLKSGGTVNCYTSEENAKDAAAAIAISENVGSAGE